MSIWWRSEKFNVLMMSATLAESFSSATQCHKEDRGGAGDSLKKLRNRHKSRNSRHKGRNFRCFSFDLWGLDAGKIVLFKMTRHKIHLWTWFKYLASLLEWQNTVFLNGWNSIQLGERYLCWRLYCTWYNFVQLVLSKAWLILQQCHAREFHRYNR